MFQANPHKSQRTNYWHLLILLTIIIVGLLFRSFNLAGKPFWIDELYTSWILQTDSLIDIFTLKKAPETHPPLYHICFYLYMKAVFAVTDTLEPSNYDDQPKTDARLAARLPTALTGGVVIAMMFWWSSQILLPKYALLAAFWSSISAFLIFYSQEARMYMLFLALSLLSNTLLIKGVRTRQQTVNYGIVSMLLLLCHYFSVIFLFSQIVGLLTLRLFRDRFTGGGQWLELERSWRPVTLANAIAMVCFMPWLLLAIKHLRTVYASKYLSDLKVLIYWKHLALGFHFGFHHFDWDALKVIFLGLSLGFLILGSYLIFQSRRALAVFIFIELFLPPLIITIFSFNDRLISAKYQVFIFPNYLILITIGFLGLLRWGFGKMRQMCGAKRNLYAMVTVAICVFYIALYFKAIPPVYFHDNESRSFDPDFKRKQVKPNDVDMQLMK